MIRWVLVGPALAACMLPMAHAADAESQLKTIGCAKIGYTMLIPRIWAVHGACTPRLVAVSDDQGILMIIEVARKAVWNDARARAAIAAAITTRSGTPVGFSNETFKGRTFLMGTSTTTNKAGTPIQNSEIDTFQSGYVYSFLAEIVLGEDPSATVVSPGNGLRTAPDQGLKRRTVVADSWTTIKITRN